MPEGPLGGPRPFAKEQLMPGEIEFDFHINNQKLQELEEVLNKYPSLQESGQGQGDRRFITDRELIIITYKADKPLSSIRLYGDKKDFTNDMSNFFFVYLDDSEATHMSRFKTLIEIVEYQDKITEHSESGHTISALSDINADLAGLFYGFDSKNIAGMLQNTGKEHLFKE